MLKAAVFDLDGTLTTSDAIHLQIWKQIFKSNGVAIDDAFFEENISGRQNDDIIAEYFPHLNAAERHQFGEDKEAIFFKLAAGQLKPLPGLFDLLDWIRVNQLKLALVTNAPRPTALFMLKALGLADAFDPIVIAGELPRAKPDPMAYRQALRRLGIKASQAVVFEDSPAGIQAALGADIPTIGLTTTHSAASLLKRGVSLAIDDFTDGRLLEHLGLFGQPQLEVPVCQERSSASVSPTLVPVW